MKLREDKHRPHIRTTGLSPHVPARLLRAIFVHVYRNLVNHPGPLLLGIHGPAGAGKSFGVATALRRLGARAVHLSAGDMESPEAGEPARRVRQAYLDAGRLRDGQAPAPAALVFDDADVSLGDWGENVQYTVNRQTVCGELMQLADRPQEVEGRAVRRVPIIVTGNNLGRLYPPLVREGRMALLNWTLQPQERVRVLCGIFPELRPADAQKASVAFSAQPIAFFADLRRQLEDNQLIAALEGCDPREMLRRAARNNVPLRVVPDVTLECLLQTGRDLLASRLLTDHLGQGDIETLACDVLCGRTAR